MPNLPHGRVLQFILIFICLVLVFGGPVFLVMQRSPERHSPEGVQKCSMHCRCDIAAGPCIRWEVP